jgi:hypothetical protein
MQLTLDERFMQTATQAQPISKRRLWTGRAFSGLVVLFLVFDSMGKFFKPAPVVEGGDVASQLRVGEPLFGYWS